MNRNGTVKSYEKYGNGAAGCAGFLTNGSRFGSSLAYLGDLDGPGPSAWAMAVGAPGDQSGGAYSGCVWIMFMDAGEVVVSKVKIGHDTPGMGAVLAPYDYFGSAVANLGDLDGDGVVDLAVGVPEDTEGVLFDSGSVWILFLNTDGTVKNKQKITATEGGFNNDLELGDEFGISLATMGDLNGDGVVDLAVGSYLDDDGGIDLNADRGAAWLLFLNTDGTVKYEQKISSLAGGFGGLLDDGDAFGRSVVAMGDHNGDGLLDLAVGACEDDDGGQDRGAMWFLSLNGHTPASATLRNPNVGGVTNPNVYTVSSPPAVGGTFSASVTLRSGQIGSMLLGYATPLTMAHGLGNVLVNFMDPAGELLGMPTAFGDPALFNLGVPGDVSFIGFEVATQAVRFGSGLVDVTNAQDLLLGW